MKFVAPGPLPPTTFEICPEHYLWKTWGERTPQPLPPTVPFDFAEVSARLLSWKCADPEEKGIDWSKAVFSPALSQEEAAFWFLAMVDSPDYYEMSMEEANAYVAALPAKVLAQVQAQPSLTREEVRAALLKNLCHEPAFVLLLYRLIGVEGLIAIFCQPSFLPPVENNSYGYGWAVKMRNDFFLSLCEGMRSYLLPYLTETELASMRELMGMCPENWESPREQEGYYYLAACIGRYDAVRSLIAQPEELKEFADPLAVVFGLESPEEIVATLRRLKLPFWEKAMFTDSYRDQIEKLSIYVALTGWESLDVVAESAIICIKECYAYQWLQRYGNVEGIADAYRRLDGIVQSLAQIERPEMVPVMLAIEQKTNLRTGPYRWLVDHPELTVAGLLPLAAGDGELSEAAARRLDLLCRRGHGDFIQAQLAGFEDPADAARVKARLFALEAARMPVLDKATTPAWLVESLPDAKTQAKKKPAWAELDRLPMLRIEEGCLNSSQIEGVLAALAITPLTEQNQPLFVGLKAHVRPEMLDEFLWGVYDYWMDLGFPVKQKWVITALGLLGNDATAVKLAGIIRKWPGASQTARAVLGLQILATIGSDAALMQINSIAQKVQFKALKAKAQEAMETIAAARNLTGEQLADRLVPDCGLEAGGGRIFDFGPRQFRFVLGPDLKPMVRDGAGKLKDDLPKPNSKDDAELAKEAVAEWKELKKQIREVAGVQVRRLEQAMANRRRWAAEEFKQLFVAQPFMVNLARLVLWGSYDAEGRPAALFRITEDGTPADVNDDLLTLEPTWRVGLVHPWELSVEQRAVWGEHFSDYEIVAPFSQLGREIYALTPDELRGQEIVRFAEVKILAAAMVGALARQGWQRDESEDQGAYLSHAKYFPTMGVTALVEHDYVVLGYMEDTDSVALKRAFFVPGRCKGMTYLPREDWHNGLPLDSIDPVVLSEVLRDLTIVAGKGS